MYEILVVDDEVVVTMQLEQILASMGYAVVGAASSGEEAIEMARLLKPDLILMDIVMPEKLDGIEASEIIKAELDIPVIFLTAYTDDGLINRAKKATPFGYIVKPFHNREIMAVIEVAICKKKVERELKESEERFRLAFENNNNGMCLMDLDGRLTRVNDRMCNIFGYSRQELENMTVNDLAHPEDLDIILKFIKQSISREIERAEFQKRYIHKRGDVVWGQVSSSLVRGPKGDPLYFIFNVQDTTERKRAEVELWLHAAMMDNVAEGIYLIGLDDLIIKWTNEKFTRMFGYDPGEMVGKQVDIVNAPTERTPTETRISIMDILKETGEWHGEVRNIKRDGTHFWCYANVSLFDHPEYGKVIMSVHTDITKSKQAEKSVRESELRYRSLTNDVLDTSSVGIFILDSDFQVVWVNHALERYFGLRRKEVIGKDKRQLIRERIKDIFEDPVYFTEKVFATYDDNTYIEHFECHIVPDSEREERWLEHWSQPILSGLYAGGRVEHYSDITERKQAEEELQKRMNELETFYHATLGREERVIELKQEVNELSEQLGKNKKYRDYS